MAKRTTAGGSQDAPWGSPFVSGLSFTEGYLRSIRMRPGMYLGSTDARGMHWMADEVLRFALSSCECGRGNRIEARSNVDGSLMVADDGVALEFGQSLQMLLFGRNIMSFHRGKRTYSNSLFGFGLGAVCALSSHAVMRTNIDGRKIAQRFEGGRPVSGEIDLGATAGRIRNQFTFRPDPAFFADCTFEWNRLAARLEQLAFLKPGLKTSLHEVSTKRRQSWKYPRGIADYLNPKGESDPIFGHAEVGDMDIAFGCLWSEGGGIRVEGFANFHHTARGGTHVNGFKSGIARVRRKLQRSISKNARKHIGIHAIVHVRVLEPQFESQSRIRLNNPEVEPAVADFVARTLESHPEMGSPSLRSLLAQFRWRNS